jgi:signal transduction histidine kinase
VTVTDTGCGIQSADTTRIFDRLVQTTDTIDINQSGLGLGLYICRELIARHGGRIWVESEVGHGSTFCFTLPCCLAAGRDAEPAGTVST